MQATRKIRSRFLICSLFLAPLWAQSPYQGQEQRALKALSEAEIASYLAGEGMGFAKAAELNQFPGPKHVLEMASQLNLTEQQRLQTQIVFDAMKASAVQLGSELVEAERRLDQAFASGQVSESEVDSMVAAIARIQGEIRSAHLKAHVEQRRILTPDQVAAYDGLRGYHQGAGHNRHHR